MSPPPRPDDQRGRPKRTAGGGKRASTGKGSEPPRRRGKAPPRAASDEGAKRAREDRTPQMRGWGGVARRGARQLEHEAGPASVAWRQAMARSGRKRAPTPPLSPPEAHEPEQWIPEEPDADRAPRGRPDGRPDGVAAPQWAAYTPPARSRSRSVEERLREAGRAFDAERFRDAERILRPLAQAHPNVATVRELRGLTLYRLQRWRDAIRELEEFRRLTGSVEQHPVLADCYRALRRFRKVEDLWSELRAASPSGAVVTEGRIVAAGALADRGDLRGAIRLLEAGPVATRRPREHHLRLWYALGDLYERAGDLPRARGLFHRVAERDPELGQVALRLATLV